MRRRIVLGLILLNTAIAAAILAAPAISQIIPMGWLDCCKGGAMESVEGYCCIGCCWFVDNCHDDDDCSVEAKR